MKEQRRSRKAREKWHDRMPVIVLPDKYDLWLDPDVTGLEAIRDILTPYDANLIRPVSFQHEPQQFEN